MDFLWNVKMLIHKKKQHLLIRLQVLLRDYPVKLFYFFDQIVSDDTIVKYIGAVFR